jgi:CRP-like cAMP-binding protein
MPLFDNEPYAATTIADEDCVLIRLQRHVFDQLMKDNQELHFKFTRLLAHQVRYKFTLLKALSGHDPQNKIIILTGVFKEKNKKKYRHGR